MHDTTFHGINLPAQTRIKERDHRGHEMDKIQKEKEKYVAKGDPRLGGTETRLESARRTSHCLVLSCLLMLR